MKYIVSIDQPLLSALAYLYPQSSKNTLRSWIKEGRICIDNTIVKNSSTVVLKDQCVSIGQKKKFIRHDLPILYEDRDLIVVDKPCGLLSVSTEYEKGETVHSLLKEYYRSSKIFVIHRLDQATSGALVFALNEPTCIKMKELFERHDIEREYIAIVEGEVQQTKGTWRSYQYEDSQYYVHETPDAESGRLAITHYQTLFTSKRYSSLKLKLETGRKNQIRVHCQSAGHPVVGDTKYGAETNPIKRLGLHAFLLAFQHPFTKKYLRFESPIPNEFFRIIPEGLNYNARM